MIPQKQKVKEREFRKYNTEQQKLYEEQKALGYFKLDIPIRHGWYKELIITQSVERYRNKDAILEVYAKLRKAIWGRTKKIAEEKWLQQSSAMLIYKDIPTISSRSFRKLSVAAQRLCVPFWFRDRNHKKKIRFYINIPKGAYRIKFTKAYITHRKRIDPTIEGRLEEINNKLLSPRFIALLRKQEGYWRKLNRDEKGWENRKTRKKARAIIKEQLDELSQQNIEKWQN